MTEVIIKNNKRQPFLAVMYHDVVCRRRGSCSCAISSMVSPQGKRISMKNPASFQIDALSEKKLEMVVMHLPMVKSALKSGWLSRVDVKAPKGHVAAVLPSSMEESDSNNNATTGGKKGRR
jgi:hypothetical protein